MRFCALAAGLVACFIVLPLVIVVPMSFSTSQGFEFPPPGYSFGHYAEFFASGEWMAALTNSLLIGVMTAIVTLLLVIPASFALERRKLRGRAVLRLMLMLPLLVPSIVMALGFYEYFGSLGMIQTYWGLVVAHICGALPVAYLVVAAPIRGLDRNLERAAMSLGAGPLRTFRLVTFPIIRPALIIGLLFAFMHSFDEGVISLFIAGHRSATLPSKMFESLTTDPDPIVPVISTLLLLLCVLVGGTIALLRRPIAAPARRS